MEGFKIKTFELWLKKIPAHPILHTFTLKVDQIF